MLSYQKGPDYPLVSFSIGEQLERTASSYPDYLALVSVHQQRRFTWSELIATADRLAAGLRRIGLEQNDRAGVYSTNCWEWVVFHLACARAGIVVVNVSPACRAHELQFLLARSRMKALFLRVRDTRADYASIVDEACGGQDLPLRSTIFFDTPEWHDLFTDHPQPPARPQADDVTNIQYTSGTTGHPKGVLLTHRNLVNNGRVIAHCLQYTAADRICIPVPMSHCFGCVIGTMASIASGAAMILPNWTFDAGATLAAIHAERATSIYGVPTMFIAELRHPEFDRYDVSSLRTGVMAGAPCPIEIMRQVIARMRCTQLTIGYGLTETSPIITMSRIDDDLDRRVSTVGSVAPATEIKVVSTASGEVVDRGTQGELYARGYAVMKGYDDEPEATDRAIDAEGWFRTGDLGVMREDGYLKITGRAKDVIIRGGENISPREIEEFLYRHPKVAEVSVTGVPDERLGETVVAWIRLKPGETAREDEIRDFCRGEISHFKVPQYVRFVDSFPTTVSGKIQKFRIREIEIAERGLTAAANVQTA
jgi:fatty-acyl-CoA synthase